MMTDSPSMAATVHTEKYIKEDSLIRGHVTGKLVLLVDSSHIPTAPHP